MYKKSSPYASGNNLQAYQNINIPVFQFINPLPISKHSDAQISKLLDLQIFQFPKYLSPNSPNFPISTYPKRNCSAKM